MFIMPCLPALECLPFNCLSSAENETMSTINQEKYAAERIDKMLQKSPHVFSDSIGPRDILTRGN
jgi:hypothetical protein